MPDHGTEELGDTTMLSIQEGQDLAPSLSSCGVVDKILKEKDLSSMTMHDRTLKADNVLAESLHPLTAFSCTCKVMKSIC